MKLLSHPKKTSIKLSIVGLCILLCVLAMLHTVLAVNVPFPVSGSGIGGDDLNDDITLTGVSRYGYDEYVEGELENDRIEIGRASCRERV